LRFLKTLSGLALGALPHGPEGVCLPFRKTPPAPPQMVNQICSRFLEHPGSLYAPVFWSSNCGKCSRFLEHYCSRFLEHPAPVFWSGILNFVHTPILPLWMESAVLRSDRARAESRMVWFGCAGPRWPSRSEALHRRPVCPALSFGGAAVSNGASDKL
jgi:hypothetical protein